MLHHSNVQIDQGKRTRWRFLNVQFQDETTFPKQDTELWSDKAATLTDYYSRTYRPFQILSFSHMSFIANDIFSSGRQSRTKCVLC